MNNFLSVIFVMGYGSSLYFCISVLKDDSFVHPIFIGGQFSLSLVCCVPKVVIFHQY